eukprot:Nitzschia sp. Nitz4//scaffold178_size73299//37897//38562//NITZ4_005705-RA/size73299-processed-gene-0.25-mRNA-1//1//CDS//3329539140//578//frame0
MASTTTSSTIPPPSDMKERKNAVRKEIRGRLKEMTVEETISQSSKVCQQVTQLPEYQKATKIGLFLSMPKGEIRTDDLVEHAIQNGKTIYIPVVGANFENGLMEMHQVILEEPDPTFYRRWPTNKWKIPEPPADMPIVFAKPGDLDCIIVPGLSFDKHCHRLGHGKGYYDRFIERMSVEKKVPLVAIALQPQFYENDIPVSETDIPVDKVVFPHTLLEREG